MRRRLLALGLGLFVSCVAAELLVRVFAPQPKSWLEVFRELPEPLHFGLIPGVQSTVDTGDSRWTVRTDAEGRRVDAVDTAGGSERKGVVPVVGDSFVFGHGVDFSQSFVGLLDSSAQTPFAFRDEGVPGYGPIQYRALVERDLAEAQAPRGVIVVSYLGNDFFDCIWDKRPILNNGTLGDTGGLRSFLKRHVQLYRLVSRAWHAAGSKGQAEASLPMYTAADWAGEPLQRARSIFEREFSAIRDACTARGIPLLVVLIPPIDTARHAGESAGENRFELPVETARGVLQSLQVACLDTTPALLKAGFKEAFLRVDGHLSARGNALVRDGILESLARDPAWK